jgi:hypothetical protein
VSSTADGIQPPGGYSGQKVKVGVLNPGKVVSAPKAFKMSAKKAEGGVVSLAFLKELSQKKGFSLDPELAFKSLKVGDKMALDYDTERKVAELVSSNEKGLTFNIYDHTSKTTQLHSGPNSVKNPNHYTQTIVGDKQKKQLKMTWGQFYRVRRTAKSPHVSDFTTYPYSGHPFS